MRHTPLLSRLGVERELEPQRRRRRERHLAVFRRPFGRAPIDADARHLERVVRGRTRIQETTVLSDEVPRDSARRIGEDSARVSR